MLELLIGAAIGLLPVAVLGLRKLAAKTKTQVDDHIVAYVDANLPWIRKQLEERARSTPAPAPREKRVDHRK